MGQQKPAAEEELWKGHADAGAVLRQERGELRDEALVLVEVALVDGGRLGAR